MSPTPTVVTKMVNSNDPSANKYIGKTVYGMSGYPYGVLEEVRNVESGYQEFWVRNHYGLIMLNYFCLKPEDWE